MNKEIHTGIYQYLKKDKWIFICLVILSYGFYLKTIQIPKHINSLFLNIKHNNQTQITSNFKSLIYLICIIFIVLSLYDWMTKKIEKNSHIFFMKYFNDQIMNTLEHNYIQKTDAVYYINQTMFSHRIQYLFLHMLESVPFFIIVISIFSFLFTKQISYTIPIFLIGSILCIWLYYQQTKKTIYYTKQLLKSRDNIIQELQDINNNKYAIYSFDKYTPQPFLQKQTQQYQYQNDLFYKNDFKCFYIVWTSYFVIFSIIIYLYYTYKQNLIDIILIALLFLSSEVIKRLWHLNSSFIIAGELTHYQSQLQNYIYNKGTNHPLKLYQMNSNSNIILKVNHVSYMYSNDIYILKDVHLEFEKGKTYSLTGKNGCGKSTLLKLIYGLYKPSSGDIILHHKHSNTKSIQSIKEWRQFIHYREQFPNLFNTTIYKNIVYGNNDKTHTHKSLKEFKHVFQDLIQRKETTVSGGQKQIISLFRLLNYYKPIVLLDEPSSALDKDNKKYLFFILDQLKKNGSTIIMVSHDKDLLDKSDRVIDLSK